MSTDADMGEAALAAIPPLSDPESELGGTDAPLAETAREVSEDWLYFHIECARRAREAMDRISVWGNDYAYQFSLRAQAIEAARVHLRRLLRGGAQLPPLLERMVQREELTP